MQWCSLPECVAVNLHWIVAPTVEVTNLGVHDLQLSGGRLPVAGASASSGSCCGLKVWRHVLQKFGHPSTQSEHWSNVCAVIGTCMPHGPLCTWLTQSVEGAAAQSRW